jgi:hypothetical protein
MTALYLQKALMDRLAAIFAGQLFPTPHLDMEDRPEPSALNIYEQALPIKESSDQSDYMPYIAVRIKDESQNDEEGPNSATVYFDIGTFCDDKENHGHEFVCNIIENIKQDFFKNRSVEGAYLRFPFKSEINDEDYYPYNFGCIETHWDLPVILSEDPLL